MGSWFGKVVGGAIGFALGGPVGAAIGVGLGAAVDESEETNQISSSTPPSPEWKGQSFTEDIGIYFSIEFLRPLPENVLFALNIAQVDGVFCKSNFPKWSDKDGDFYLVFHPSSPTSMSFYIPFGTFQYSIYQEHMMQIRIIQFDEAGNFVKHLGTICPDIQLPSQYIHFSQTKLLYPLIQLGMQILKCKGKLLPIEVKTFREFLENAFQLTNEDSHELKEAMKQPSNDNVEELLSSIHRRFEDITAPNIINMLSHLALCKGAVEKEQVDFFYKVMDIYGFQDDIKKQIAEECGMVAIDYEAYYACFDLLPTASLEEVTRAYRQKASEYHPDKHTQLPKKFQEFANKHLQELNEAYAILKKKYSNE